MSNNEVPTFLVKLLQKPTAAVDRKLYIFVQTKWFENRIELVLQDTSTNKCYKGKLTHREMKDAADELEMPYNEYFKECEHALTNNISLPGFEYEINAEAMAFRVIKQAQFTITYLEVTNLQEVPYNTEILETAVELIDIAQKASSESVSATEKEEIREYQQAFEKCLAEKNSMEATLYEKFKCLLDSKKMKIEELQTQLNDIKATTEMETQQEQAQPSMKSNTVRAASTQAIEDELPSTSATARCSAANGAINASEIADDSDDAYAADTQPMTLPAAYTANASILDDEL